ncbi:MAG: Uma2 family endonuclease [Gemmatimonadaceae bacterium]
MLPATDLMTAEQLLTYDARGQRTELVRGRLVVKEPAGYVHGSIAARVLVRIAVFLETDQRVRSAAHPLGDVLAAETGFTLQRRPDTVRAPDVAFVAWERIPIERAGFAELAPDLAVEVLSPGDRAGEVLAKVADWLNAGTSLVWVIDPARRVARVYRADGTESIAHDDSALEGEAVLPGLVMPLAVLFV